MKVVLGILLGGWLCLAQTGPPANHPENLAAGERLYMGACGSCHGPRGDGGRGSYLAQPRLPRAPDDKTLFNIIRRGIEGTEMPGAWRMVDKEVWQVVAYVRSLGRVPKQAVPGDPVRGEQLYRGKGNCAQCHTLNARGGRMGPELADIGARRNPAYLKESLLEPGAAAPDGFLQVTVVTKDGRRITGIRLNENTFSIQLRDLNDRFHSFWKSELAELRKERDQSPMPGYRDLLTASEVEDLVAYLTSLRGGL